MTVEIEGVWVVCSAWSEQTMRQLAGNRRTACAVCSAPVVISTEGRGLIAENPLTGQAICMECAARRDPDVVPEPAPGAIERAESAGITFSARERMEMRSKTLRDYKAEGMS